MIWHSGICVWHESMRTAFPRKIEPFSSPLSPVSLPLYFIVLSMKLAWFENIGWLAFIQPVQPVFQTAVFVCVYIFLSPSNILLHYNPVWLRCMKGICFAVAKTAMLFAMRCIDHTIPPDRHYIHCYGIWYTSYGIFCQQEQTTTTIATNNFFDGASSALNHKLCAMRLNYSHLVGCFRFFPKQKKMCCRSDKKNAKRCKLTTRNGRNHNTRLRKAEKWRTIERDRDRERYNRGREKERRGGRERYNK